MPVRIIVDKVNDKVNDEDTDKVNHKVNDENNGQDARPTIIVSHGERQSRLRWFYRCAVARANGEPGW